MLNKFKILSCVVFLLGGGTTAFAMQDPKIAVRNNYGAQIEVTYTLQGNEIKKAVALDQNFILGPASKLQGDVKIARAGAFVGHLAAGYSMPINGLSQIWAQQQQPMTDTLLLTVTSQPGKLVIAYRPVAEETLRNIDLGKKFEGGVLDQFAGLKKYGLEKTLTPAQILAIRSWKDVVIQAGWHGFGAITGEDIARYILGLTPDYNEASVKKAYQALSLQWHPDKQTLQTMKDFAQQVMPIINHARDLLLQALQDKGQK